MSMQFHYIPYKKRESLIKINPFWYIDLFKESKWLKLKSYFWSKKKIELYKFEIYNFFTLALQQGNILLGKEQGNWDKDRQEIDTIIIHHTKMNPGIELDYLSAVELVRLYAPYYAKPLASDVSKVHKQLISSGHIRNGKQVFWPYHWLVRENGEVVRLLEDNETGWQAGNRSVNCRSIGIAIDDDLTNKSPNNEQIFAIKDILKNYYPNIDKDRIFGHNEIKKTECPGSQFLGINGWKRIIINNL